MKHLHLLDRYLELIEQGRKLRSDLVAIEEQIHGHVPIGRYLVGNTIVEVIGPNVLTDQPRRLEIHRDITVLRLPETT